MTKKKAQPVFPKKVFVQVMDEENPWLSARESIEGIDHGVQVGIYELVEIKIKKITEELI